MQKNNSKGKTYHSQRNNKLRPEGTCGPTSASNALEIINVKLPGVEKDEQVEDHITALLQSDEGLMHLKSLDPKAKYNPWNSSQCIVWAVNKLAGKEICSVEQYTLAEIIYHLVLKNGAIAVGTSFTKSRHFVCLVGVETAQENILSAKSPKDINTNQVTAIIIDDSWGDFNSGYQNTTGDNISIPIKSFLKYVMEGETKKTCQVYYNDMV
jgi:hypothetical protein